MEPALGQHLPAAAMSVKSGTPVDNQVGVWTGDGTIEGTSSLVFDGTSLALNVNLAEKTVWCGGYGGGLLMKRSDATADRYAKLGILDASGGFVSGITVDTAGRVGIGTSVPATGYKLDVQGDLSLGEAGGSDNSYIDQKQNGHLYLINSGSAGNAGRVGINKWNTLAGGTTYYRDFIVYDGKETALLTVDGSAGNVGIGTSVPAAPLTVAGATNDGNSLAEFTQSGTGRGLSVLRNISAATRQMVSFAQTHATGGTSPVVHIQQADTGETALAISTDGSTENFTVSDVGDVYSGGSVGIGTDAPKRHLQIYNPTDSGGGVGSSTYLQLTNLSTGAASDGDGFQLGLSNTGVAQVNQRENLGMVFSTNNTERLRIDPLGLCGIGTASPTKRLHVVGAGGDAILVDNKITGAGGYLILDTESAGDLVVRTAGSHRMSVNSTGVGIGTDCCQQLNAGNGACADTSKSLALARRILQLAGDPSIWKLTVLSCGVETNYNAAIAI